MACCVVEVGRVARDRNNGSIRLSLLAFSLVGIRPSQDDILVCEIFLTVKMAVLRADWQSFSVASYALLLARIGLG
jgi:hypothetical protein